MPKEKITIDVREPAERPYTVALSKAEVYALLVYHQREMTKVRKQAVKVIGTHAHTARDITSVRKHAKADIDAHFKRAQGLHSIIA